MPTASSCRKGLVVILLLLIAFLFPLGAARGAGDGKAPANLFANPSFEQGREEWRLDKTTKTVARWTVDQADAKDGQSSALITIEAVEDWGVQFGQSFAAAAKGTTCTFAALAKATKAPVKVRLEIERSGTPYDRAAASEPVTLTNAAWTELHVTFKVEKDFKQGWFAYMSCAQPNVEFRIDMMRLYEGEYVPYEKIAKEEAAASGVGLFDTGTPSAAPLSGEAIARRAGWTQVAEGDTAHAFKGDAVLANGRLTLVLRQKAAGAELYGSGPAAPALRTVLTPAGAGMAIAGVKVAHNAPDGVAAEAAFRSADGKAADIRFELLAGQVYVKTEARGTEALRLEAASRFALLPDFFADDMVIDAVDIPVARAELPSENFLLQMLVGGEAILMSVAASRDRDAVITLAGQGADRRIIASEVFYGKEGKVWVGVLEAPGIWYERPTAKDETGKVVDLPWKAPFPAQWRMDWRKTDKLVDSWEVIAERPGGEFEKPGVFGSPSTIGADRKRWTTVLGQFKYPCWLDQAGQAHIQPLKSDVVRFEGPALLYPINRVKKTPLGQFTAADIMRSTLGVGPCEYILDLEGQGSQYKGRATCATRDTLRPIFEARQQKAKRAEIEKVLDEVMVFVKHIRGRIEIYADFGHKTLAYIEEQKKARPELAGFAAEMEPLCKAIDGYVAKRKNEIKTVDYTQAMVDNFRKTMLDSEGDDAYAKCKKFTEDLVVIGGNQDELAGEGRMAVKIIRQRAGLAMATDPRAADVAREIRRRAQEVLRNPAGHEGARH
jgi:hypothetical protein